jgi:hypothetical protein
MYSGGSSVSHSSGDRSHFVPSKRSSSSLRSRYFKQSAQYLPAEPGTAPPIVVLVTGRLQLQSLRVHRPRLGGDLRSNDFEQGEIGPDLFRHACLMGLEGLVSKHKDRPYRAGRSPHWVKVKNRQHPAMERVMDTFS